MKEILEKLEDAQNIDTDQIIRDFIVYYREHDRHEYHEITVYIINKFKKAEEGETISVILFNLERVMESVAKKCKCTAGLNMNNCLKERPPSFRCSSAIKANPCYEYKRLYRKLNKLYDHISLEYARTSDIREQEYRLEELLKQSSVKQISLENVVNDASEKIGEIEDQAQGLQKEYITILGIFASIVLAFTGGIAFSTSVLENIDAVSPYRLAATVIGLAFVMINIVYILVWFIQQINKHKDETIQYPCFMKVINVILVLAVIATIVCWYFWDKKADPDLSSRSQYSISVETKNELETKPE